MAVRFARRVSPLLVTAALATSAVISGSTLASAAPRPAHGHGRHHQSTHHKAAHHAKPTITSVQKQLGQLAVQNSQLVERFDRSRVVVAQRMKAAAAASLQADQAARTYRAANVAFTRVVQAQYESGGFAGASTALFTSENGGNYLDRLNTMDLVSSHQSEVVSRVTRSRTLAATSAERAATLLAGAKSDRSALGAKRDKVQSQIATYKKLLAKLNSAQQAAYARAQNPTVSKSDVQSIKVQATTAGARQAVQFALHQVGKPYVFGEAGPNSYDCSGLTMSAWQHGGVSLPHSAAEQYNYGTHVGRDQLQPGDLIFFYQPIGHVTIYIGNGLMVSAPTEGENVSVVPLDAYNSDYAGATHIG